VCAEKLEKKLGTKTDEQSRKQKTVPTAEKVRLLGLIHPVRVGVSVKSDT